MTVAHSYGLYIECINLIYLYMLLQRCEQFCVMYHLLRDLFAIGIRASLVYLL